MEMAPVKNIEENQQKEEELQAVLDLQPTIPTLACSRTLTVQAGLHQNNLPPRLEV